MTELAYMIREDGTHNGTAMVSQCAIIREWVGLFICEGGSCPGCGARAWLTLPAVISGRAVRIPPPDRSRFWSSCRSRDEARFAHRRGMVWGLSTDTAARDVGI